MRVNDLRTALKNYDTDTLIEIAVTLYKVIPKGRKEDEGLDEILLDFSRGKAPAKKEPTVDFDSLKAEIEQFIEYADEQYYYAPNRYVRKEKRSKWRFEVKRFIKDLLSVRGENSEDAARLLTDIYAMLCYACNYWIFSSDDPFSAVGYKQTDFLRLVLEKLFFSGFDEATVRTAVFLTLDSNVDRETLYTELSGVLVDILKTPDTKELALKHCIAYKDGYDEYQTSKEVFSYKASSWSSDDYRKRRHSNNSVDLYLMLKISLFEIDDGIDYFWKNYVERDREITLYCLLRFLNSQNDLWIREYEKAVANGIKPRDNLKKEYASRKAQR